MKIPKAKKIPHLFTEFGQQRTDDYYWLRDRKNPAVLDYLKAENDYYQQATAHTKELQEKLFEEISSRMKKEVATVPFFENGYWYQTRYEETSDYPIYVRRQGTMDAPEEVLFDCNAMAKKKKYFHLSDFEVSDDNQWAVFGIDTVSRRQYTLQIKNLCTGEVLPYCIKNTNGEAVWAADNRTIFYVRNHLQTLRSFKVYRHTLGTDPKDDVLVYQEKDDTFEIFVYREKSRKYLVIGCESTLTSEYRILKADTPEEAFSIFQPRIRGLEYDIAHYNEYFYVLTNKDGATNFKLMRTPEEATSCEHWQEIIPHNPEVLLNDLEIFKDYLVVEEVCNGLERILIRSWDGKVAYYLPFDSETYTAYTTQNVAFDTPYLRYNYQSLSTPASIIEVDMRTGEQRVLKEQEILGGQFDKHNYTEERLWATAPDGVRVPISLVYRKGIEKNGQNPLLLYGYGSYGITINPSFSSALLSLLDRGFIYAIAHIRGGEYLGRQWYEEGKLLKKKNTFSDFIACAKHLIGEGYTSPEHLYAKGGSAGGLLMGVVANEAPELFHGIVAAVPFVDVVTTMLDETIPLTTGEYDEWGNPNEEEYYHYMLSYSPYDQVRAQNYPAMYVSTGLHDSQVQYWEPAKWVAKLRTLKTDPNPLYLDTHLEAGHGGASGRFEAIRETAKEYAFLLDLETNR